MRIPRLNTLQPRMLKPDLILPSIHDLTPELIKELHIRCLVCDVDDTLTSHRGNSIGKKTLDHLKRLRQDAGLTIFLASNSRRDLSGICQQLDARVIRSTLISRKPRRHHFKKILQETSFPADQTAMIGDKLLTDVLGGNLAGMTTIYVLSRRSKFFHE